MNFDKHPVRIFLSAVTIYILLTALFYAPVLPHLSGSLIGPPEDNYQFLWFIWYGGKALFHPGWNLMHSNMIYYPEGMDLHFANYFYYGFVLAAPFLKFITPALCFNLLILSSYVLAGIGTFRFLRWMKVDPWIAVLGGYIFAFNPSHQAHADHHVTIASIQFIPFFAHYFLKSMRGSKRADIIRTAIFGVLQALCDWNYLVYGAVFGAFTLIWRLLSEKDKTEKKRIAKTGLWIAAGTVLPLMPLLIPMVRIGILYKNELPYLPGHNIYVADLLGFFTPYYMHPLSEIPVFQKLNSMMSGNAWESAVYFGWANLICLALAARHSLKSFRFFWAGLTLFAVLSLGTNLHFLGRSYDWVMPYQMFEALPFLKHARNPSRIIVWAYLFLAALSALSLQHLKDENPLKKKWVFVLACLIFLDFFSLHRERTELKLPAVYDSVTANKTAEDYAILEIPWDGGRYMAYQTLHGLPIVQGYLGRKIGMPLAARLPYEPKNLAIQKQLLKQNRVKYIIIHKRKAAFNASKPLDLMVYLKLDRLSKEYAKVYPVLYEDEFAASFEVY